MTDPAAFAAARANMLAHQLRDRGISDARVLAAMGAVPRELFVEPGLVQRAYGDEALPTLGGQTISQPLMVAIMTQLLAVEPGMRVLEVGAGSGYQAAILGALGCRVTGVERLHVLAEAARGRLETIGLADSVEIVEADGSIGHLEGSPWPRIMVSAGARRVPATLVDQLADQGRLVIPVGSRTHQDLLLVERRGAKVITTSHGPCVFVPLVGVDGWA